MSGYLKTDIKYCTTTRRRSGAACQVRKYGVRISMIDQGIASREFTRHETDIVQDNLNEIRKKYAKMRKDGVLTMQELERLDKMLDENSKMICRKEHNRDYNIKRVY